MHGGVRRLGQQAQVGAMAMGMEDTGDVLEGDLSVFQRPAGGTRSEAASKSTAP